MLIKALVENTTITDDLGCEHGLSLYIETAKHIILFDVGASELFFQNAKKLGVNIADVDFLVISHGHYDHGGGLKAFLRENEKSRSFPASARVREILRFPPERHVGVHRSR
jgi:7,8-dihydropterin-6-yl-methyl-4-(beta-D-ribofuranosyl)aminobenzene 5'-phosphate synthase